MQDAQPNLFFRNDTILGVCQGLGEDFGFNPNYLRIAFAALLYFIPLWVIGTYLALGAAVAFSRWLRPTQSAAVAAPQLAAPHPAPGAANEPASERLAA